MAYYWVSQNKTFDHEFAGGYLWAPLRDKRGGVPHHWRRMQQVQPGDTIFSYRRQSVPAIAVATTKAYPAPQPTEFRRHGDWEVDGLRIDVEYRPIDRPILLSAVPEAVLLSMQGHQQPLNAVGTGNQGYLFPLAPLAAHYFLDRAGCAGDDPTRDLLASAIAPTGTDRDTTKQAVIDARRGQGLFRRRVDELWGHRCCATGLDVTSLLRASHIQPWRDSNNSQRLDPYNGLLLSVGYDLAFDLGFITFDHAGKLILSPQLFEDKAAHIGVRPDTMLSRIPTRTAKYLEYHQEHIFRGRPCLEDRF